jgi:jasmonate ZIM domain-containing protein
MDTSSGDLTNGGGATSSAQTTTKPLTMFYNGGVAVFHLPQDKVSMD